MRPGWHARCCQLAWAGRRPRRALPRRKLRTDAKVRDVYKIGKTIGTGGACAPPALCSAGPSCRARGPGRAGFAVVKVATEKASGQDYAVKIMNLPEVGAHVNADTESTREDIFKEIDILVGVDHENVLELKEYFEEGGKARSRAQARCRPPGARAAAGRPGAALMGCGRRCT